MDLDPAKHTEQSHCFVQLLHLMIYYWIISSGQIKPVEETTSFTSLSDSIAIDRLLWSFNDNDWWYYIYIMRKIHNKVEKYFWWIIKVFPCRCLDIPVSNQGRRSDKRSSQVKTEWGILLWWLREEGYSLNRVIQVGGRSLWCEEQNNYNSI